MKKFTLIILFCILTGCSTSSSRENIDIEVTSFLGENPSFRDGDEISFLINLNEDAWVYMYYENSLGHAYQLMPSALAPDNFIHAGDFIPFPNSGAPFQLVVSAPFGQEKIWMVAYDQAIPLPHENKENLKSLPISLDKVQELHRHIIQNDGRRSGKDTLQFTTKN